MREFQQKHIVRTLFYSKATMLVLFLLIILLIRSVVELNAKRVEVNEKKEEVVKERKELEKKVGDAEKQVEFIKSDRGFEAYVRTTYPVVKEGEGVIVIYDDNKNPVTKVRTEITMREKINLWWKKVFE
jgi:cell division protein FtsB